MIHVATGRAIQALPPDRILRLLFRLDRRLYDLEGRLAIAYGGGVHTKHRHTRYHDFFVERIGAGERVLDVGCGSGALAHDIATRSGANVVAVDINPDTIAEARNRFRHPLISYCCGDVSRSFVTGSFDVIVLSNVLEHLTHRSEFLHRLILTTRPARILIRVPLFERDWRVPLRQELGVEWRLDPTHRTEYTIESFADELASAGLAAAHQEARWGEIWADTVPIDPSAQCPGAADDEGASQR